MNHVSSLFPIQEPLLIFTVLIGIILLSPFIFRKILIPDIAAFLIMGVLIGPYGFHVLTRDASIDLLGIIGLLYIMFMAGLELDIDKFKASRRNSLIFGLATFLLPFLLGVMVTRHILHLGNQAALLVSIMFSTHTLVAYPIVRKVGVNRDMSVLTAVGGTIITDTLVLLILSLVTQDSHYGTAGMAIARLVVFFGIYTFLVFFSFPRIARWFFKHIKRDRPVHYLFLLFMVCVASYGAELIGTEPIIGAFLAGLALNRSIPKNSLLMHHIDFVGNVLFIPVFLIGIGMLINTRILISGPYLWYVSFILIFTALAGKWLAAFISQKILKFSHSQRNLLFGLTSSHAAATIAIIVIGYEKQILDNTIFNATVLIILVSSLVASIITEKSAKRILLNTDFTNEYIHSERILVPISNPSSMPNLIGIASCFQRLNRSEPVFLLNILNESRSDRESILKIKETLEKNVADYNDLSENLKVITRVDVSISSGIIRTAKEYIISDIVFGWGGKSTTTQRIFGNIFDHLFRSLQTLFAVNITGNISDYNKLVVHIPSNAEYEPKFPSIIGKLCQLPKPDDHLVFRIENAACTHRLKMLEPKKHKYEIHYEQTGFNKTDEGMEIIHVFFLFRKESVAYNLQNNSHIQRLVAAKAVSNFILVVPGFD